MELTPAKNVITQNWEIEGREGGESRVRFVLAERSFARCQAGESLLANWFSKSLQKILRKSTASAGLFTLHYDPMLST